jgi:hypothetical protein
MAVAAEATAVVVGMAAADMAVAAFTGAVEVGIEAAADIGVAADTVAVDTEAG